MTDKEPYTEETVNAVRETAGAGETAAPQDMAEAAGKAGKRPGIPRETAVTPGMAGAKPAATRAGDEVPGTRKTGVDAPIVQFLKKHHVLTLATTDEGIPYCSNAFYCYEAERNLLIFTSDMATRHAQQMARNPRVAASVVLETRVVGRVQGLQLCGTAHRADETARRAYLKRFPYAVLAELTLWAIVPDFMKFTDNTLGFGKKLIWNNR